MQKKVLIIHKGKFDKRPPLISVKNTLNTLGYKVDVLTCGLDSTTVLDKNENVFTISNSKKIPFLSSLIWYVKYVIKLRKLQNIEYDFFWIEGGDTISLFGWVFKKSNRQVLQLSELYDKVPHYKFLIGLYIHKFSKIVVPEINRAYIIKVRYNLINLPKVLPNKPNYTTKNISIENGSKVVISKIKEFAAARKILLYQGIISTDRKFNGIVEFVTQNKDEFCIVLLGKDNGYLSSLISDEKAIFYAGFLNPPHHLIVTKLAWACILAYDTTSLNKVYCAPNKIWEYSLQGKPILSQDLPGIKMIFENYKIGVCCDVNDCEDVSTAVKYIDENYQDLNQNSSKFFNSIDVQKLVEKILEV